MTRTNLTTIEQLSAMPGLSSEEQRAGIVLLRELAKGEPVAAAQFAEALGVSIEEAEALLRDSGLRRLTYVGEDGRVVGFWGLSTTPTHHQLTIKNRTLWAWCAGDTLFLPELLGETAEVESRDPETGELIRLTISPVRVEGVEPKDVTVSFLWPDTVDFRSATQIMATACHHIFFFASRASGERWVASLLTRCCFRWKRPSRLQGASTRKCSTRNWRGGTQARRKMPPEDLLMTAVPSTAAK